MSQFEHRVPIEKLDTHEKPLKDLLPIEDPRVVEDRILRDMLASSPSKLDDYKEGDFVPFKIEKEILNDSKSDSGRARKKSKPRHDGL